MNTSNESAVVIGIATAGRREQMRLTLDQLERLEPKPARVIVCPAGDDDFDAATGAQHSFPVEVVRGPRGSAAQRNTILDSAGDEGIILFIDDDFYPATDYLLQLQRAFASDPSLVCVTNRPVADGATGPGYAHAEALDILAGTATVPSPQAEDTYGGYGCNMGFSLSLLQRKGLRFDAALPLYGWLEDIDFSRRVAPFGRIANWSGLRGVHLATKRGRTSGVKLGYSQVVNPIYMVRKGSMRWSYAARHVGKNVAKNLLRYFWQEPWVDRRGRLKGNLIALSDVLTGRAHPGRILDL